MSRTVTCTCEGDERWAWAGLALFTGLCVASAFLITLNEH